MAKKARKASPRKGTKWKRRRSEFTPGAERQIVREYRAGATMANLAETYECSMWMINQILLDNAVLPRRHGGGLHRERNERILEMWKAGKSARQIAAEMDMTFQRVHQIVKRGY